MIEKAEPPEERLTRSERISIRISITQTVLAVAGIFIGSVALYAALSESEEVRKQTEASVWPRVGVGHNRSETAGAEMMEFIVANYGIGPAVIKGAKVTIDGAPHKTWFDVVQTAIGGESPPIRNASFSRAVIPAGESMVALHMEKDVAAALNRLARAQKLDIEVCYCSVFDQCWLVRYSEADASPVRACPDYGADAFQQ